MRIFIKSEVLMTRSKTSSLVLLISLAAGLPIPQTAIGADSSGFSQILDQEMTSLESALQEADSMSSDGALSGDAAWYFRRTALRLRAKGGVLIPGFAKVEI